MNVSKVNKRNKDIKKGPLMVVRTSVFATLFLTVSLFAANDDESDKMDQIQNGLNSIINKAGIHFGGTFRSQYMQSALDQDASGSEAIDGQKKQTESNEYTSVDFDIGARPNESLSARAMFRMHQNWQNFFSDVANPIFTRWLSIDGNIKDMIRFNVGDYRQKYSPLTLWSPDIEIAYEPEIFARKRREAMNEAFLGNNDRLLQGVNFNFDAEVVPVFNEFHFNAQASRLRLSEISVKNGSAPVIKAETDAEALEKTYMDRYFVAGNLDLIALNGLGAGLTYFKIFDHKETSVLTSAKYDPELIAKNMSLWALRFQPTSRILLESDMFDIGINFEVAGSNDRDTAWYDSTVVGTETVYDSTATDEYVSGMAIDAGLNGTVKFGESGAITFNLGFMNNGKDFRNDMAQSPTFLGRRIMNVENDHAHGNRLYTTFDALYNYVFKFIPSANNDWTQEPRRKISYFNGILSGKELEMVREDGVYQRFDNALQLVLPGGAATANRTGPKGNVKVKLFEGGVDLGGSFAMLNEAEPLTDSLEKASFFKAAGGACVDIATWVKPLNTCKLSFGYSLESFDPKMDSMATVNSGFLNVGLYYNFWKRFSLLAGYQQIAGTITDAYERTITQVNMAFGLEYKVNEDQIITGRIGQMGADFTSDDPADSLVAEGDFRAIQTELYLTVNF